MALRPRCAVAPAPRSRHTRAIQCDARDDDPPVPGGADVFRLNFSHARTRSPARFADDSRNSRQIRPPDRHPGDVHGPKTGVGRSAGGRVHLQQGRNSASNPDRQPATRRASNCRIRDHPGGPRSVRRCCWTMENCASAWCTSGPTPWKPRRGGGPLSDHKGVNVPDVVLRSSADGVKIATTWIRALTTRQLYGLSFVQRPEMFISQTPDRRACWVMASWKSRRARQLHEILAADGCSHGCPRTWRRTSPEEVQWRKESASSPCARLGSQSRCDADAGKP